MKKVLWLFLSIFLIWWVTFWIAEKDVDLYGQALSDALIKKIEDWSLTSDKVVSIIESWILYYEKDLEKPIPKKDSKNNLKAFQIMDKNIKNYLNGWEDAKKTEDTKKKYTLVKVVDWDTIRVTDENGKNLDVRMIWIDSPEASTQRYWYVECYWEEATKQLEQLLKWVEIVEIETDVTQWMEDKYWRLLWYVFDWSININQRMLYLGYAWEYTYDKPYKYIEEFKKAESQAKTAWRWLWHGDACGGERKQAEEKKTTTTSISDYSSSSSSSYWQWSTSSSSYDSSSSSNSSYRSDKCSAHNWRTWERWWCYYKTSSGTKVYDSSKECCR